MALASAGLRSFRSRNAPPNPSQNTFFMKLSTHRRRPDRRAHSLDAGGWLPLLPLDLRPGVAGHSARKAGLAQCLRESASLTAHLQRFGATQVIRVRQTRARPNRDEAWFIGAPGSSRSGRSVMVREVVLTVDGVPWVFAHTLANRAAIRLLRRAGRKALAVVLFTDPQVSAGPLQYRRLDVRHPLYRAAQPWCGDYPSGTSPTLMARRALFTRGAARLLVTEVFLPPVDKVGG
jgi:chorismate--pyruvate lyase